MKQTVSVQERVAELVREHGSYRAAGEAVGVMYTYLHRMSKGCNTPPAHTLRKLGLEPGIPSFKRLQS